MEKTRPEEVKNIIDDLNESEKFLLSLSRSPEVGAFMFVFPVGTDMTKVFTNELSPEEIARLDDVVETTIISPMLLRAWYYLKEHGAVSFRGIQRKDPRLYVAMLRLLEIGFARRVKAGSGFIAIDEELHDRTRLLLSIKGKEIWEEFGCPK